jgi:hypothetical protein
VLSSINGEVWSEQVGKDEYGQLKKQVPMELEKVKNKML